MNEEQLIEERNWSEISRGLDGPDLERVATVRRICGELRAGGIPFWLVAELPNPGGSDIYRMINWRPELFDEEGNLTPAGQEFSNNHLGGLANAVFSTFRSLAALDIPMEKGEANWKRARILLDHFNNLYNENLVLP